MRLCLCALIVAQAAGLANAGIIFDGTIRIDNSPWSVNNGGEFTATPITGFLGLTGLASDVSTDSFESFCVEVSENFSPGSTYLAVINTGAVAGSEPGGFDPLDERTAFLYTLFRAGTLPGFDYSPAGRQASTGDLQAAIWYLEGESNGANNSFVALADAAVSSGDWSGIHDVRVLNIYDGDGVFHQDQLTLIPVPGAGLAMSLAGLAASGRRRR